MRLAYITVLLQPVGTSGRGVLADVPVESKVIIEVDAGHSSVLFF